MVFYAQLLLELIALFVLSRLLTQSLSNLFFRIIRNKKLTVYLLSFLFFPGTVIHELAHMFMAIILFVPVGNIDLFPSFSKGEVKLGSIEIAKTDPVRRAIIGFAPVLAGLFIMLGVLWQFFSLESALLEQPLWKIALAVYVLFEIGNTMFSSKKDLEGTIELLATIIIAASLLYVIGVRIPETIIGKLFSGQILEFIKTVNLLLLVPIGVNVVGWGMTKLFGKL